MPFTSKWDNLHVWAKTLEGFPLIPTICYILNSSTFVPLCSILQGSSIYPASWERMQHELPWVLEKIMFSFIVGGSLLAVRDFYCIIQDYNVILWCLGTYVNLVSPTTLSKLSLEEDCAQWKVTGELLHTCALVAYYNIEFHSSINISVSKDTPSERYLFLRPCCALQILS